LSEDEFTGRFGLIEDLYGTGHPTAKQLRDKPCTLELLTAQAELNEAEEAKRHAEFLRRTKANSAPQ
jgi:hypothetical protein